jgi:hypothetical protein
MKITIMILSLLLLVSCASKEQDRHIITDLIKGDNLDQWGFILEDSLLTMGDIWSVKEGVLYCSGAVNGYIYTKEDYSDYTFSFNWRWPDEAGNSGVLLHITNPDEIWPVCIEAQLQAENAADFIMMGGTSIKEQSDKTNRRVPRQNASNEKIIGEWNHYKIICRSDSIQVFINDLLQNQASQASVSQGKIGLQSEGKPIEFKNITLEQF